MEQNGKKIQYFTICTSVSLGGKSLYSKRDEEDNPQIKKDDSVWKKVGSDYDAYKIEQTLTTEDFPNYTKKCSINIQATDFELCTKQKVTDEIQAFFNNTEFEASLLIISGYGGQVTNKGLKESYFVILTKKGDEHVVYNEIADMWLNRTSKDTNKHLLIIIDVPNSGCWVTECRDLYHYDSISIQASSGPDEQAHNIKNQGGILIHNFLELNGKNTPGVIHKSTSHHPCSIGIYPEIKLIYKLELMLNSWDEFKKKDLVERDFLGDRYTGAIVDKKKSGSGIMKYHNGDVYKGDWKDDKKNGLGTMLYFTTGEKYAGFWKNDQFEGKGQYTYGLNHYYQGEFSEGQKSGKGVYYYANGNRHEGQFKEDKSEGFGILYYKSGNKYEGMFSCGKKNGKGIYTYSDGGKYEGELKNDKFCGQGIFLFNNGNKYDGAFLEGKKSGKGVFDYKSGNKYNGDWKDDKFNGFGKFYFKTGDIYEGEFKDGVFSGIGKYIYKNTDCYEGEWKHDQKNGQGTFFYKNGDKFIGLFKNGKRNGDGTYTSVDGKEKVGKWKDDEFVK